MTGASYDIGGEVEPAPHTFNISTKKLFADNNDDIFGLYCIYVYVIGEN
jgi:hypothetical protein